MDFAIQHAGQEDLPAILALQRAAYASEARLVGSEDIPPLRQTLADLQDELKNGVILKAFAPDGTLAGSVRARLEEGTAHIGKLMVRPDLQGKGLGTRLLAAIEGACPASRYELFTSRYSERNLLLYGRCGYREYMRREIQPGLEMVFLEKAACDIL